MGCKKSWFCLVVFRVISFYQLLKEWEFTDKSRWRLSEACSPAIISIGFARLKRHPGIFLAPRPRYAKPHTPGSAAPSPSETPPETPSLMTIEIFFSCPLTTFPAQKMGQLHIHQIGNGLSHGLSDIHSNHPNMFLRLTSNSLEKADGFWYINFYFHRRFFFRLRIK